MKRQKVQENMKKIAFIGCGNMGQAMALAAAKTMNPSDILLTNRTRAKAETFAAAHGMTVCTDNKEAVSQAEMIMLCVKPQMMQGVLEEIRETLKACLARGERRVLVTVAAMLNTAFYYETLGVSPDELPVVRTMPNTPVSIGKGIVLCSVADDRYLPEIETLKEIFAAAGRFETIPESQMNAAGTLSGCTPAFAYLFIEALSDGGVMAGVPRKQAIELAAAAVQGAAAMVLETGKHPGQLKDEVCSPAGTTIEGVKALEEAGFRNAAFTAVIKAVERGK